MPLASFFFLHRIVDVFKHYFEELEEESLRDNFVVVVFLDVVESVNILSIAMDK
ncbi:Longin-like domain superfamily [Sesbania bispinosa]|nr:Longin-like domain superfamily [Sesbania bispinosa]